MSDELREIELETARLKLERERLALGKELRSQQRVEDARSAAANMASAVTSSESKQAFKTIGKGLTMLAVGYVVLVVLSFVFGFNF